MSQPTPPEPDLLLTGRDLLLSLEATLAELHDFTNHLRREIVEHEGELPDG